MITEALHPHTHLTTCAVGGHVGARALVGVRGAVGGLQNVQGALGWGGGREEEQVGSWGETG